MISVRPSSSWVKLKKPVPSSPSRGEPSIALSRGHAHARSPSCLCDKHA